LQFWLRWSSKYSDVCVLEVGIQTMVRQDNFSSPDPFRKAVEPTKLSLRWVPGVFLGTKRPGHGVF